MTSDDRIVGGRYERQVEIASGGLATVYRGFDREREIPVAVKIEHDDVHESEQVREHFRQELRWFRYLAVGPRPGSLVHFFDGRVTSDPGYIITELIDGPPVDATLAEGREPGVDTLRAIAPHVCRAMAFLHRNDVLHLDCKPDNVLLRSRDLPAVIDLNSAIERGEGTTTLFHHDPYKPPELTPTELRDAPVGPWSDVYALGTFLGFLLTGEAVTFESESVSAWSALDVLEHGADCSPELASVVTRATDPYPAERFEDAAELTAALTSVFGLPDRTALLVHDTTGRQVHVRPGDSIGRFTADEPIPAIVLPDEDQYLSPTQATIEYEGGWLLRDHSLNGTFVHDGSDWQYALSRGGLEHRKNVDAPLPVDSPPESVPLVDGARISPVRPDHEEALSILFD